MSALLLTAKRVLAQKQRQQLSKAEKQAAVAASRAARKEAAGRQRFAPMHAPCPQAMVCLLRQAPLCLLKRGQRPCRKPDSVCIAVWPSLWPNMHTLRPAAGASSTACNPAGSDSEDEECRVVWGDVPLEVVAVILQSLDPVSLAAAACVCR